MAKVNEQLLGRISGKLGNLVYRKIGDTTFVSTRPEKYNYSTSEKAVKARKGFSNLVAFAVFVNSIPILNKIWGLREVKGKRAYNKIISHNKSNFNSDSVNKNFRIVPKSNSNIISFYKSSFISDPSSILTFSIQIDPDFLSNSNVDLTCFIVLVIYNKESDKFMSQVNELILSENKNVFDFSISIDHNIIKKIDGINNFVIFSSIVLLANNYTIAGWTDSYSSISH